MRRRPIFTTSDGKINFRLSISVTANGSEAAGASTFIASGPVLDMCHPSNRRIPYVFGEQKPEMEILASIRAVNLEMSSDY